jgi:hypothetical protein
MVVSDLGRALAVGSIPVLFAACLFVLAILTTLNSYVRDAPSIEIASNVTPP